MGRLIFVVWAVLMGLWLVVMLVPLDPYPMVRGMPDRVVYTGWTVSGHDGTETIYKRTGRIVFPMHEAVFDEYMSDHDPSPRWWGHNDFRPRRGRFAVGMLATTLVMAVAGLLSLLIQRRYRRRRLAGAHSVQ